MVPSRLSNKVHFWWYLVYTDIQLVDHQEAAGKQRNRPGQPSGAATNCAAPHFSGGPPRTVDRPPFVSIRRDRAAEIRRYERACHDRKKRSSGYFPRWTASGRWSVNLSFL